MVASCPPDLEDRRVEITGPAEPKMMINALNSGAKVFMADLEDSLAPTWENILLGQESLFHAVRRTLTFTNESKKVYALKKKVATLIVRPRGWHLSEKHVLINHKPASASLFDFGIYFFHNAQELMKRGTGPYFYLPKMESHLEARLWNDVFQFAQETLKIPQGTIRATVLIETILAAFEMDEILYELREHSSGLNAGRWDYIFSMIKKFQNYSHMLLPDRAQVTMDVPFMKAYAELLVQTCHQRGAHAMGGMSAFIPSRRDNEINQIALAKVTQDKEREVKMGFDGTWVAHPDLVSVAQEVFDKVLIKEPHQKNKISSNVKVTEEQLIDVKIKNAQCSEEGMRMNIEIALCYLESWLSGSGAVAIHNLMEDAATAEISRAQIWQWIHHNVNLSDGRKVTPELYQDISAAELKRLKKLKTDGETKKIDLAAKILDSLILNPVFVEFLTLPAYDYLD